MAKVMAAKFNLIPLAPALLIAAVPTAILYAAEQASAPAAAGQQDAVDAPALAAAINAEVDRLAPTSSISDYEASIMFVISQQTATDEVVLAALDLAEARPNLPETLKVAIENIRQSLRRKKVGRGTGALGDGVSSSFSSPSIGLGGGSTNYTQ